MASVLLGVGTPTAGFFLPSFVRLDDLGARTPDARKEAFELLLKEQSSFGASEPVNRE